MKTYFIDIDGTIVPNLSWNDLKMYSKVDDYIQELLPGVSHFFNALSNDDIVIFTTARGSCFKEMTERTLKFHNIKYREIIYDLNVGPRILINDTPNIFFHKSIAINVLRDSGFGDSFIFDEEF